MDNINKVNVKYKIEEEKQEEVAECQICSEEFTEKNPRNEKDLISRFAHIVEGVDLFLTEPARVVL